MAIFGERGAAAHRVDMARRALVSAVLATAATGVMAAEPPALDVVLTPQVQEGRIVRLDVDMRLSAPAIDAGKTIVRAPVVLVGTPMAAYPAEAIRANDEKGELTLTASEEPATPTGTYRRWTADRATVGDVRLRYGTAPRVVNAETRNGPLFDLRSEAGGIIGSGNYFYALPESRAPHRVSLHWDLSKAPAGWRGVWSLGEGDQTAVIPPDTLAFSFYAAGPVQSKPQAQLSPTSPFAFYWLSPPPFDPIQLATDTEKLYKFMSKFFEDAGGSYRVFVRGNPYKAGGGTALAKSFMFSYGVTGETASGGDEQMLLAHEMAHNWPRLDGDEHALTAWYTEGTAEYYSTLLALRAGAISLDKFLKLANEKADDYYTNPYRTLSNAEAGKKFWQDARAQRVPYGRGFMYFARLDALLRASSKGKKRLDDLVLAVQRAQRRGGKVGLEEWDRMVTKALGAAGRKDFDAMVAGERIEMPPTTFGPCFKPVASTAAPFELGFDDMRLGAVSKLVEGSAAAKAGLKEGDRIVDLTPLREVRENATAHMALTVERDGQLLKVDYLPRGTAVPSVQWARVTTVPDTACKL
ncbi:Predicted metalloprotease, contains C-terminal PDZ domain [Roseateles sp. YR242]|uniref:M61 family metallopeptidase n=1 Tax=Roseateles sp. YR242 TaxID=1855305 RepID=UPI0008D8AF4C|nr:hypothetical protein [Roseateles sp. YR242]SEK87512.1 Predicted metalloprotease, contains C-terminal PDZ domain [Roseateles sp. YR242]